MYRVALPVKLEMTRFMRPSTRQSRRAAPASQPCSSIPLNRPSLNVAAVAFGSITGAPAQVATDVVSAQAQPPEAGAPPTTPGGRPLASAFGVAFPDLASRLGWQPVGRRDDVVDGREVRTVVYARAGRRLAWSVIDGAPVPVPPGATSVPVRGPGTAQFESGGRVAVLTTRGGH